MLNQQQLKSLLHYDSETGIFTWRVCLANAAPVGSVAGTIYKKGNRYITIRRKRYQAHRLAWLYVYGTWPSLEIDHRNLERDDNRIQNLREATNQGNSANRRVFKGKALPKGVTARPDGRYRARIRVDGKLIHLGYFNTPRAANAAYAVAAKKYFGDFARAA